MFCVQKEKDRDREKERGLLTKGEESGSKGIVK